LRIISHKWLGLNLKAILSPCVVLLIRGFDKRFIMRLFDDYYNSIFSPIQRLILLPVYMLFKIMVYHDKLIDRLMKHHKKYRTIKNGIINITY
jgi:hypothetical protein